MQTTSLNKHLNQIQSETLIPRYLTLKSTFLTSYRVNCFVPGDTRVHSLKILRKPFQQKESSAALFQYLPTSQSLSIRDRSENVSFAQQDGLRVLCNIIILFRSMNHSFGEHYQHL